MELDELQEDNEPHDKIIECVMCGGRFIFSMGEADFFKERGLDPPKRCPECRHRRKALWKED